MPWPENLIRNIAKNNIKVDDMVEKKKLENDNNKITNKKYSNWKYNK